MYSEYLDIYIEILMKFEPSKYCILERASSKFVKILEEYVFVQSFK